MTDAELIAEARARVRAYIDRRAIAKGYDPEYIHGYDVSKSSPNGIALTVPDLTTLLDALEAAQATIAELQAEIARLHDHIEGVAKDTHKIMVGYEAKLAKAVKALHNAAIQLDWCQAAREISKEIDATLAEIKGESHD